MKRLRQARGVVPTVVKFQGGVDGKVGWGMDRVEPSGLGENGSDLLPVAQRESDEQEVALLTLDALTDLCHRDVGFVVLPLRKTRSPTMKRFKFTVVVDFFEVVFQHPVAQVNPHRRVVPIGSRVNTSSNVA